VENAKFSECIINQLAVAQPEPEHVTLENCEIQRITGIAAASGVPSWIRDSRITQFDALSTLSLIKQAKLPDELQILVTIVKKTFFQKGTARKEVALFRGLGALARTSKQKQIVNVLLREGILTQSKGDEGILYAPVRKHSHRMGQMLSELTLSKDPIWLEIARMAV
jgi:hypothetical protein